MMQDILDNIKSFFEILSNTIYLILQDLFYYLSDTIIELSISALNKVAEMMDYIDFNEYYSKLPTEVYNAVGALGLGIALNMIIATILLKIVLKMTPFSRFGGK